MRDVAPEGSAVYVLSRGDPDLVEFTGRDGRHFPEDESGAYAGHYPEDERAAVALMRAAAKRGGEYLVVPDCAFWWLARYPAFQGRARGIGGQSME